MNAVKMSLSSEDYTTWLIGRLAILIFRVEAIKFIIGDDPKAWDILTELTTEDIAQFHPALAQFLKYHAGLPPSSDPKWDLIDVWRNRFAHSVIDVLPDGDVMIGEAQLIRQSHADRKRGNNSTKRPVYTISRRELEDLISDFEDVLHWEYYEQAQRIHLSQIIAEVLGKTR